MSTRISGAVNRQGEIRGVADRIHLLETWAATTTATSSFTATAHSFANAMTSTMGQEVISVTIEPLATDGVISYDGRFAIGATESAMAVGMFYGTASHPFDVGFVAGVPSAAVNATLSGFRQSTSTATANISVRIIGGGSNTIYVNSDPNGNNLSGQTRSILKIMERQS